MKKNIIFDFDGVIFPDPDSLHLHVLESQEFSFGVDMFMRAEQKIPLHFYDEDNREGLEYINAFWNFYYSLRINHYDKERLQDMAKDNNLFILSYNDEAVIRRKLELSSIDHLFNEIISVERKPDNKIPAFKLLLENYGISISEISFITDTVSDIKEAQKAGIYDIYAVVSGKNSQSDLLQFIDLGKIISPFYNKKYKKKVS